MGEGETESEGENEGEGESEIESETETESETEPKTERVSEWVSSCMRERVRACRWVWVPVRQGQLIALRVEASTSSNSLTT